MRSRSSCREQRFATRLRRHPALDRGVAQASLGRDVGAGRCGIVDRKGLRDHRPDVLRRTGDGHVAIRAAVVGRRFLADLGRIEKLEWSLGVASQDRVEHRDFDALALACPLRRAECREQADGGVQRRRQVGARVGQVDHRGPALASLVLDQARCGVHGGREGAVVAPGRVAAEAVHRNHHRARIRCVHGVPSNPEAIGDARAEVLEHDVAHAHQIERERPSLRLRQVDAHVAFAEIRPGVETRLPTVVLGRDQAREIARGRLDLDHVGAELGEDASRVRSREHLRKIEDAHVRERSTAHVITASRHASACCLLAREVRALRSAATPAIAGAARSRRATR